MQNNNKSFTKNSITKIQKSAISLKYLFNLFAVEKVLTNTETHNKANK